MGKLMNNYFYGKAGKADYTTDDLPTTRMQLFKEMLRVRLGALCKLNLLYMLVWLPAMIILFYTMISATNLAAYVNDEMAGQPVIVEEADESTSALAAGQVYITNDQYREAIYSTLFFTLLFMIPAIGITGPFTAGAAYVTRNWARDEHSFMFSDFKDAVKANWKQSLVISLVTGATPFIIFVCWYFYGDLAASNMFMIVPQVLVLMLGIIWALSVAYMHPLIVGYKLRMRDVFRNGLLLAVARLPMSVGLRLLHCVPIILALVTTFFFGTYLPVMLCLIYYAVIGFALSRFVTASYVNGVFDKYINSRIEGAVVGRGLAADDDDEEDEETVEG